MDSILVAYSGDPLAQQALTDLVPSPAGGGLPQDGQTPLQFQAVPIAELQRKLWSTGAKPLSPELGVEGW